VEGAQRQRKLYTPGYVCANTGAGGCGLDLRSSTTNCLQTLLFTVRNAAQAANIFQH